MKKFSFKFLTAFIAVVVTIMSLPMNVLAAELQNSINQTVIEHESLATETSENNTDEQKKQIVEVTDLRTESTKTFRLPDGNYYLAQYSSDIHALDENGKWKDIDNTLSETGNEIGTSDAKIKFAKKLTGSEKLFALNNGNKKLTLSLNGATKGVLGQIKNNEDVLPEDATELQKMTTLNKISASVIYEDILPNTDLEYVIIGSNIKENIIVKAPADSYSYSFTMLLNNLTAVLNSAGDIIISDVETNEIVYTIPAPVMWDANGVTSHDAWFSLTNNGNGKYTLTVTADSEWMNESDRQYPITIDPPIYASAESTVLDLDFSTNSSAAPSSESLWINSTWRAYWKLASLPTLPESAYITNAMFSMECFTSDALHGYVGVYDVLTDWDSSLVYSKTVSDTDPEGKPAENYTDFREIYTSIIDENIGYQLNGSGQYQWNVTPIVKKWYSGENYGLMMAPVNGTEFSGTAKFYSNDYTVASKHPKLVITYRDMKGIEDYWSYTSQSVGFAGSGSINNATGNLVFAIPTLTSTDALMPFTPTLVYNSSMAGVRYEYENAQTSYGGTHTAMGFKWNITETLIKKTYLNSSGTTQYMYIWSDGDGTEHYFISTGVTNVYMDEDGLLLTLVEHNDDEGIRVTVTDSGDTVRTFEQISGSLAGVESRWYLKSITDKNGNKLSFGFDSGLKPTSVVMTPNNGSDITQLCIAYYNYRPYVVYNPHTYEAVIFRYSSSGNGATATNATAYLRQIVRVHSTNNNEWLTFYKSNSNVDLGNVVVDAVAEYSYDTSGRITSVTNNLSKYKLVYQYDSSGRVISVTEQATATTTMTGQQISLTYGTSSTVVRTSGSDDIFNNSDDLLTTNSFDLYGRTVSYYTTDADKTQIYGASSGQYEDTSEKTKNSIKSTVNTSLQASNYLINGGFEMGSTSNSIPFWSKYGGVSLNTDLPYDGNYDLKLSVSNTAPKAWIKQYNCLPEGEYTLSIRVTAVDIPADVSLKMTAEFYDTGITHTKELSLNDFAASGEYTFDSLSFSVNSGYAEEIHISIELTGNTAADVTVDNIMLSRTIGAAEYDMMHAGSFDLNGFNGRSTTDFWYVWNESTNEVTNSTYTDFVDSGMDAFGKVAYINSPIDDANTLRQTVYTAPQNIIDAYIEDPTSITVNEVQYTLSGWGKGTAQSYGEGIFCLSASVTYIGTDGHRVNKLYSVDFDNGITDWQFASLGFATDPSKGMVESIEVELMYGYNPGVAYFDDISFIKDSDTTVLYKYHNNGFINSVKSGKNKCWYSYDDNDNLIKSVTSDGSMVDYTYDPEGKNVVTETYSRYKGAIPVDSNDKLILNEFLDSETVFRYSVSYEYTDYGAQTKVSTYQNGVNGAPDEEISSQTVYNDSDGSPIFGTVSCEIDSLGRGISYHYNEKYFLEFVINHDGNGTGYVYDGVGNLTAVYPAYTVTESVTLPNGSVVDTVTYHNDTSGTSVQYGYDESTNRLETITTKSSVYGISYDEFGNSKSIKVGNRTLASYEYKAQNGKLNVLNYGNGDKVKYIYDHLDRISEIQYNIGVDGAFETVYKYTYDTAGNLYSVTDLVANEVTMYRYDNSGKLVHTYVYDSESMRNLVGRQIWYDDESRVSRTETSYDYQSPIGSSSDSLLYLYSYNDVTGNIQNITIADSDAPGSIAYSFDLFERLSLKRVDFTAGEQGYYNEIAYDYLNTADGDHLNESILVSQYKSTVKTHSTQTSGTTTTYNYTYDNRGNITEIKNASGVVQNKYHYDDLGQLVREDNRAKNATYVYEYDNAGNITAKKTYAFTIGTLGTATNTVNYTYGDTSWGDLLTKYGSTTITYDAIGNPLTIGSHELTWQGRELISFQYDDYISYSFEYNADGIRTAKIMSEPIVGCVQRTEYILNGSQIIGETMYETFDVSQGFTEQYTFIYLYDESGAPIGLKYRTPSYAEGVFDCYFFEKNLQGDIIAIYNESGVKIGSYTYDAWGKCTATSNTSGYNFILSKNPFRYRGYYYDTETGYYYLQSRYYNPTWGRFLNADGYINANGDLIGFNMFAYCSNSPIIHIDEDGYRSRLISWLISKFHAFGASGKGGQFLGGNNTKTAAGFGGSSASTGSGYSTATNGGGGTSSGSSSYTVPKGGGGVSDSVQVGEVRIDFGHGGRRAGEIGIGQDMINNAIANDVIKRPPTKGNVLHGTVTIGEVTIFYNYYTRSPNLINVGTYYRIY